MAMAAPRLLRGLIAPLPLSPADWLPCHQQLLTSAALLHRCSDGFKLFLVPLRRLRVHGAHPPPRRPRRRRESELPSVGDIVFFRVPTALQNCGINKDVVFIKRVIATPGNFIQVRQGQLIVNGVAQNEHYTAPHASSYTHDGSHGPQILVYPLLLHKQMTIHTATARGGPKVAWLLRVVDFLSTPIPLFFQNEMK
ncbi:hypothetical protein ACQJBY_013184 [Aegilops geniculata]